MDGKSRSKFKTDKDRDDEEPGTSAYWHGSVLFTIGDGKPYADWIEFVARNNGWLAGDRWVGDNPPPHMIDHLVATGRIR